MHRSIRSVRTLVAASLILGATAAMSAPGLVSRTAAQTYCDEVYCYGTDPAGGWEPSPEPTPTPAPAPTPAPTAPQQPLPAPPVQCNAVGCPSPTPGPSGAATQAPAPAGMTTPLYRLFNATNGDHLYTTSARERDTAIRTAGYVSEGVAAHVSTTLQTGLVPLYRLYHPGSGDHFYTTSNAERIIAVGSLGYDSEGTAAYVSATAQTGLVPLYRLYNRGLDNHFYTVDAAERDTAVRAGWTAEGIAAYVAPVTH